MALSSAEHFLDYLIQPDECIDTLGRTYVDDLEIIISENHGFDAGTQRFPIEAAQGWFDRAKAELKINSIEEYVAFVRNNVDKLSLANVRPRHSFFDTPINTIESYKTVYGRESTIDEKIKFQTDYSKKAVDAVGGVETDPDAFEMYLSYDRINIWTYLVRREIRRKFLKQDDLTLCIGNRWKGEVLYFRENLGLKKAIGVDLFTSDPEFTVAEDMHNMSFASGSVGLIFARGLINKSYDVRVFVREMLRVLRPDGFLIIETPIYRDGLSPLGPTDIKSSRNFLRLLNGKIKRIIDVEEPHPRKSEFMTSAKLGNLRNELYGLLHDEIRKTMTHQPAEAGAGA